MKVLTKSNLVGVCLVLLLVVVSANATATKYLEWSFEDVATTSFRAGSEEPYVQAYINSGTTADGTGNGHPGTMNNTGFSGWTPGNPLPGIMEDSPIAGNGKAVHFRADNTVQRVLSTSTGIDDTTFSTGISMRAIWQFDEEAPASSRYELMQNGGPSWQNDTLAVNWDNYGTEYIGVFALIGPGVYRWTSVLRADIESVIGHSMVGNPIVFAATYDGYSLALYADGLPVGGETWGSLAIRSSSYNRIELGNDAGSANASSRKAVVDEFAIWQGALTPAEALADYNAIIIPEPATIGLLALGFGLIRRRRRA